MKNLYKELSPHLDDVVDSLDKAIEQLELIMISEKGMKQKEIYARQIAEFCSTIEKIKEFKYSIPAWSKLDNDEWNKESTVHDY